MGVQNFSELVTGSRWTIEDHLPSSIEISIFWILYSSPGNIQPIQIAVARQHQNPVLFSYHWKGETPPES
jgi:hypothetical protein